MNPDAFDAMTTEQLRERVTGRGVHGADRMDRQELTAALAGSGDDAMTRSEEELVVSTELWETGRARLRKFVVTEDVQITVRVRREGIRLEREPIAEPDQRPVRDPDVFGPAEVFATEAGGVVHEITLHEERPVITTEIVPVERVRLSKVVETDDRLISGSVRKERIEADLPGEGAVREL
ncbi:YsnF/AvaK domain-containing protein [Actinoplanes sp. DH11]|uniref:YsnF/AvaK domain-containing protein n=1 Tax=Actinoplanes sp. DH11 TaxID=2857011 RepID=UPI001E2B1CEC|nr:YsnF/AvaK domain-containing protein [Actinoplanes sp. DH11]